MGEPIAESRVVGEPIAESQVVGEPLNDHIRIRMCELACVNSYLPSLVLTAVIGTDYPSIYHLSFTPYSELARRDFPAHVHRGSSTKPTTFRNYPTF